MCFAGKETSRSFGENGFFVVWVSAECLDIRRNKKIRFHINNARKTKKEMKRKSTHFERGLKTTKDIGNHLKAQKVLNSRLFFNSTRFLSPVNIKRKNCRVY